MDRPTSSSFVSAREERIITRCLAAPSTANCEATGVTIVTQVGSFRASGAVRPTPRRSVGGWGARKARGQKRFAPSPACGHTHYVRHSCNHTLCPQCGAGRQRGVGGPAARKTAAGPLLPGHLHPPGAIAPDRPAPTPCPVPRKPPDSPVIAPIPTPSQAESGERPQENPGSVACRIRFDCPCGRNAAKSKRL